MKNNFLKIFIILGLIFTANFSFASSTVSYGSHADYLNCSSSETDLYAIVFRPTNNLIDGGTIPGTGTDCFKSSNYSGADGDYHVTFVKTSISPAWYTFTSVSSVEANSAWEGTATFHVTSHVISSFVWIPPSPPPPPPSSMVVSAGSTVMGKVSSMTTEALTVLLAVLAVAAGIFFLPWGWNVLKNAMNGTSFTSLAWLDRATYKPYKGYNRWHSRKWNMSHTMQ